jgi:hypothetical protein
MSLNDCTFILVLDVDTNTYCKKMTEYWKGGWQTFFIYLVDKRIAMLRDGERE